MARLWQAGLELGSIFFDFDTKVNGSAGPSLSTTTVRTGNGSLRMNGFAATNVGMGKDFLLAAGTGPYYARFYINIATQPTATSIISHFSGFSNGGNPAIGIALTSAGALRLLNNTTQVGSDSSVLTLGQWYRVEYLMDKSGAGGTHVATALVDGTQFASATNLTITNNVKSFMVGADLITATGGTTGDWFFDDMAVNDSTGSFQTSYPGAESLVYLRPNADGDNHAWTTGTNGVGSATNYTLVNETTPDSATSFVKSKFIGDLDDYNIDNTPPAIGSSDTITTVSVGVQMSGTNNINIPTYKLRIKKAAAGTVAESAGISPLDTSWVTNLGGGYLHTLYQDPDGGAWTKSTLDTAQIGMHLTASPAGEWAQVSAMWLVVGFTPSGVTLGPDTDVAMWKQPVNQPLRSRVPRRQQPPVRQVLLPSATTTQTIAAVANIIGSVPLVSLWKRPTNQPRSVRSKEILIYFDEDLMVAGVSTQTITATARIFNPTTTDTWKQPVNQPLRNRTPKRQQPPVRLVLPPSSTTTRTITAVANILALPVTDVAAWVHLTGQPRRIPKRQQPRQFFIYIPPTGTTTRSITAVARIASNPSTTENWAQPISQPLRSRIPKRQQPPVRLVLPFSVTTTKTLTAVANILSVGGAIEEWKRPVNQPLRNRIPKRQIPGVRLVLPPSQGSVQTITARANIAALTTVNSEAWQLGTNQPLRNRVPRRQQPPRQPIAIVNFFTATTKTLTAVANIKALVAVDVVAWKQPVHEYLRNRIPKRQQPLRVMPSVVRTTTQTITAVANLIGVGVNLSEWKQPVNQPLRSRVSKRQQVNRVVPSRVITTTQTITAKANLVFRSSASIIAKARIVNPFLWSPVPIQPASVVFGTKDPNSINWLNTNPGAGNFNTLGYLDYGSGTYGSSTQTYGYLLGGASGPANTWLLMGPGTGNWQ